MRSYFSEPRKPKMYYLNDQEIKKIANETELFIRNQRGYKHILEFNERTKSFIVEENPKMLAIHMLTIKHIHHLYGDVVRLSKEIEKNIYNMNWFDNKC